MPILRDLHIKFSLGLRELTLNDLKNFLLRSFEVLYFRWLIKLSFGYIESLNWISFEMTVWSPKGDFSDCMRELLNLSFGSLEEFSVVVLKKKTN